MTQETKHTPGPWKLGGEYSQHGVTTNRNVREVYLMPAEDLRRFYGADRPEPDEEPVDDNRPLCQREQMCDCCNRCVDKPTIAEAIEECHDAAVDFRKTLWGWVMGHQMENDMDVTEAHEK